MSTSVAFCTINRPFFKKNPNTQFDREQFSLSTGININASLIQKCKGPIICDLLLLHFFLCHYFVRCGSVPNGLFVYSMNMDSWMMLIFYIFLFSGVISVSGTDKQYSGLELIATFDHQITGVSVHPASGRIFVNFPRWTEDSPASVAEVLTPNISEPFHQNQIGIHGEILEKMN
jgi:hypothetical protein